VIYSLLILENKSPLYSPYRPPVQPQKEIALNYNTNEFEGMKKDFFDMFFQNNIDKYSKGIYTQESLRSHNFLVTDFIVKDEEEINKIKNPVDEDFLHATEKIDTNFWEDKLTDEIGQDLNRTNAMIISPQPKYFPQKETNFRVQEGDEHNFPEKYNSVKNFHPLRAPQNKDTKNMYSGFSNSNHNFQIYERNPYPDSTMHTFFENSEFSKQNQHTRENVKIVSGQNLKFENKGSGNKIDDLNMRKPREANKMPNFEEKEYGNGFEFRSPLALAAQKDFTLKSRESYIGGGGGVSDSFCSYSHHPTPASLAQNHGYSAANNIKPLSRGDNFELTSMEKLISSESTKQGRPTMNRNLWKKNTDFPHTRTSPLLNHAIQNGNIFPSNIQKDKPSEFPSISSSHNNNITNKTILNNNTANFKPLALKTASTDFVNSNDGVPNNSAALSGLHHGHGLGHGNLSSPCNKKGRANLKNAGITSQRNNMLLNVVDDIDDTQSPFKIKLGKHKREIDEFNLDLNEESDHFNDNDPENDYSPPRNRRNNNEGTRTSRGIIFILSSNL
jgi:hypothetical protein